MDHSFVNVPYLVEKLKLFMSEGDAQKGIKEVLADKKLPVKDLYAKEELCVIFEGMSDKGTYFSFVARNLRMQLQLY